MELHTENWKHRSRWTVTLISSCCSLVVRSCALSVVMRRSSYRYSYYLQQNTGTHRRCLWYLHVLKGYSSGKSHFSEITVKLAEKNKYATHSVQRSLEMCENEEKPSVSEDFRQKSSTSDVEKFYQWRNLRKKFFFRFELQWNLEEFFCWSKFELRGQPIWRNISIY